MGLARGRLPAVAAPAAAALCCVVLLIAAPAPAAAKRKPCGAWYYNGYVTPPNAPIKGEGEACGHVLGVCGGDLCCSQAGRCSKEPQACSGTCQCKFSGPDSDCKGVYPVPKPPPFKLPMSTVGGTCGIHFARCPNGTCCSSFGVCEADGHGECRSAVCQPEISGAGSLCRAEFKKLPRALVRVNLTFSYGEFSPVPGNKPRRLILVNGVWPGPTIRANFGDRLIIAVDNQLDVPVSVHSHGIIQREEATMDGLVGVTQRPVEPGATYIYNYEPDSPGSYWWHSHYKEQYMDGVRGALVIADPREPVYEVDAVVTVSEYRNIPGEAVVESASRTAIVPRPVATLVNGAGQLASSGCDANPDGPNCKYAFVKAVASHCDSPRTKLRLMHIGAVNGYNVSIDGHRLIVVGADSTATKPVEVGSLYIDVGQRYDVLVCARDGPWAAAGLAAAASGKDDDGASSDPPPPVWIRAGTVESDGAPGLPAKALLYFGAAPPAAMPPGKPPRVAPPRLTPLPYPDGAGDAHPNALQPAHATDARPPPATRTVTLNIGMGLTMSNGPALIEVMNGVSLNMDPLSPALLERYTNNPEGVGPPQNAGDIGAKVGWNVIDVKVGDVVDVVMNNYEPFSHPFHIHGHDFWMMGWSPSYVVWRVLGPVSGPYKGQPLKASLLRDTAYVPAMGWTVVRFVADNPGVWLLHCHLDFHLGMGMGVLFRETAPAGLLNATVVGRADTKAGMAGLAN